MIWTLLLIISPLIIIIAFIAFLVIGISDLVSGIRKENGKRKVTRIVRGAIFLTIDYAVIAAIIIMIAYISLVPISFM